MANRIIYEEEIVPCGFCNGNGCIWCRYSGSSVIVYEVDTETGEVIDIGDIENYYLEDYSYEKN